MCTHFKHPTVEYPACSGFSRHATARRVTDKHLRFIDICFGQQQFAACPL